MTDGKTKVHWSGTERGQASCYGCDATPKELALRHHPKFDNVRDEAIALGFAPCHLKMAAWRWLKKGACAREYKKYSRATDEDYESYYR